MTTSAAGLCDVFVSSVAEVGLSYSELGDSKFLPDVIVTFCPVRSLVCPWDTFASFLEVYSGRMLIWRRARVCVCTHTHTHIPEND